MCHVLYVMVALVSESVNCSSDQTPMCVHVCVCECAKKWRVPADQLQEVTTNAWTDVLDEAQRTKVTPADTILDESGQPLQRNEEKLAHWRRHFKKVLNVGNAMSEEVMVGIMDNADVETPDVTREEVEKAMKKLKNGKAAGNDNIAAELLKNGGEAMVDWVTELVQEVWRTRKVPQEWKDATLVPLFKKKDQKICDNYRGIS